MSVILDEFYYAIEMYGCQAMVLEAIDEKTEAFYHSLGFRRYGPPVLRRKMLIGAKPVVELVKLRNQSETDDASRPVTAGV